MNGGYEYLNARAKGLMGRLLPPPRLKEMARLPELSAFLVTLTTTTPYGRVESSVGVPDVERALDRRLSTIRRGLWRQADTEPRRWLEPWFARRDLESLKMTLRGPGAPAPLAILSEEDLADPVALSARLEARGGVWAALAPELRRRPESPREREERLDLAWARYAAARAAEKGEQAAVFAEFLAWHIDARNLLTALRLAKDGGGEKAPFLPGGRRLSEERWGELATRTNLGQALVLLEQTPFWEAVREEAPPFEAEKALGRIEQRMEAMVFGEGGHLYRKSDPLGVSVLLRYEQLLANEARNLRRIAHGLWRRVPSGIIEEGLILA